MPTPLVKVIPSFLTPNPDDLYFIEFVDPRLDYYQRMNMGDLHQDQGTYPGARLTYKARIETQNGLDERARMVWCAARSAQDVYNAKITYSSGQVAYPIYTREYLILRNGYSRKASKSTLTSVIDLTLSSGGTGYTPDSFGHIQLIFTGGGGSGADGFAVVEASTGTVTSIFITNGGTGYTSAPTVTLNTVGGAGFTASSIIQPTSALLYVEQSQPADGDLALIWLKVTRVYETFPGPLVYTLVGYEEETGAIEERYTQRVTLAALPSPGFGTQYPVAGGTYVLSSKFEPDERNEDVGTVVIDTLSPPGPRTEYIRGNFPCPSVITTGASPSWAIPPVLTNQPPGPYQGAALTYVLTVHGSCSPLKQVITYGIPGVVPFSPVSPVQSPDLDCYQVITQPSRFLPIKADTIHRDYTITFTNMSGSANVETVDASSPASYVAGDHVIDVAQVQWKGPWMKRTVTTATFPTPTITP